jgi:hypothetical protein
MLGTKVPLIGEARAAQRSEAANHAATPAQSAKDDASQASRPLEGRVKLYIKAIPPRRDEAGHQLGRPIIQVHVRYKNPKAREVLFVWQLDKGASIPEKRPPGTLLAKSAARLTTPMQRQGDVFVTDLETEDQTRLDYAFKIVRTIDGQPAKIWDVDQTTKKAFVKKLTVVGADEVVDSGVAGSAEADAVKADATVAAGSRESAPAEIARSDSPVSTQPPRAPAAASSELYTKAIIPSRTANVTMPTIQFQVRRRDTMASEIVLVWGLNKWAAAPDNLPPGTYLTYNRSHMNTPMKRQGDLFVFDYEVPENTRLDYFFITTRNAAGEKVEIWTHDTGGQPYTAMLSVDKADEVVDLRAVWPTRAYILLAISVSVSAFFVGRLAWYLWRAPTGAT